MLNEARPDPESFIGFKKCSQTTLTKIHNEHFKHSAYAIKRSKARPWIICRVICATLRWSTSTRTENFICQLMSSPDSSVLLQAVGTLHVLTLDRLCFLYVITRKIFIYQSWAVLFPVRRSSQQFSYTNSWAACLLYVIAGSGKLIGPVSCTV